MTEKITECLKQLNELLVAAGKCQPGQEAHKVRLARIELGLLNSRYVSAFNQESERRSVIDLGMYPKSSYDLRYRWDHGEIYVCGEGVWIRTANQMEGDFREWVAKQLLLQYGIDLNAVKDTFLKTISEQQNTICAMNSKHQKLRDNLHAVLDAD
jgi:hypothetical protein